MNPNTCPIHRAWTGGSEPTPLTQLDPRERAYVSQLFREQVTTWRAAWGCAIRAPYRIFWRRARYDAHATYRDRD